MASAISVFLIAFLVASCAHSYSYIRGASAATFVITNNWQLTVWAESINPKGGQEVQTGRGSDGATGYCGGQVQCQTFGAIPATLIEYTFNGNQNYDYYDMSLIDGFNLSASVAPSTASCTTVACNKDINVDCPPDLKVDGGCYQIIRPACDGPFTPTRESRPGN